jgi:hypothetical protein
VEYNIKLIGTYIQNVTRNGETKQTQLLGERGAAQECDCDFISSGHTVIDGAILGI